MYFPSESQSDETVCTARNTQTQINLGNSLSQIGSSENEKRNDSQDFNISYIILLTICEAKHNLLI